MRPTAPRRSLVLLDVALPLLAYPLGLLETIALFVVIVALEGTILRWLTKGTFRQAARDAAIANLFSSLVGVVLVVLMRLAFQLDSSVVPTLFIVAFVLSVILEGFILKQVGRTRRNPWLTALVMNVASYLLLAPLTLWLLTERRFDGY